MRYGALRGAAMKWGCIRPEIGRLVFLKEIINAKAWRVVLLVLLASPAEAGRWLDSIRKAEEVDCSSTMTESQTAGLR